ncbi:MAG: hypothetical protein LUG27_06225 [Clostridiales bacterium]|nr:hypothetical protein [Clostridiales bacterium]
MKNIELYEQYHYLFLGCLIACMALAAITVILFFVLDIRGVAGYLSGRTARRQIQKIEEENAAGGESTSQLIRETEQIHTTGDMTEFLQDRNGVAGESSPVREEKTFYGYAVSRKTTGAFMIEREIVMIHSEEII